MMSIGNNALISIKPNYARDILSGKKTVELRRRIPTIELGTRLWIYATMPQGEVVGSAIVEKIVKGTPDEVWDNFMDRIAITRNEFNRYFDGTDLALALVLSRVEKCNPIGIEKLREYSIGFHPPRVLIQLSSQDTKWLPTSTISSK